MANEMEELVVKAIAAATDCGPAPCPGRCVCIDAARAAIRVMAKSEELTHSPYCRSDSYHKTTSEELTPLLGGRQNNEEAA